MGQLYNRRELMERRRDLRREMPKAEVILWSRLQRRQLLGCKFRRQHSVGSYVLDFYAPEIQLAVELDGDSHSLPGRMQHDAERDQFLRNVGIRVERIPNEEVYENLDGVLEFLARVIGEQRGGRTPPNPPSLRVGEESDVSLSVKGEELAPPAKGGLGGVLPRDDAPRRSP